MVQGVSDGANACKPVGQAAAVGKRAVYTDDGVNHRHP
jgi:hypothetical protein